MNNITIGQYIHGNSWLHKLDPRIKIASLILILATIFIVPISTSYYAIGTLGVLFILSIIVVMTSGIPVGKVLKGLRPLVFLLTFTFVLQLFYERGGKELLTLKNHLSVVTVLSVLIIIIFYNLTKKFIKFRILYFFITVALIFYIQSIPVLNIVNITSYDFIITTDGLLRAGFLFLRIILVVMFTSLLTFTTMTTDLNFGIESLLKPFKIIKLPVEVLSMTLSLTLRYIPTLLEEAEKIMKAQASRGVDFNESKLKQKITQVISLLIPIFVVSFKRAEDLGNAMEVRGYVVGQKRTRIDEFKIAFKDLMVLFVTLLILAGIILARIYVL